VNKEFSRLFWALADINRLKIVNLLAGSKGSVPAKGEANGMLPGELSASHLLENFPFSQPTLSHHMKILCDSGIVSKRKAGKNVYYCLDDEGVQTLEAFIQILRQS